MTCDAREAGRGFLHFNFFLSFPPMEQCTLMSQVRKLKEPTLFLRFFLPISLFLFFIFMAYKNEIKSNKNLNITIILSAN